MHMLETTLPPHGLEPVNLHLRRTPPPGGADALPDLLLIERSRSGDERAIEALIRRYSRRLFRVARSVLLDDERAEAAVLEAYLAAFGDLNRYEPTGKFAAWLTRLAFSQARALQAASRGAAVPPAVAAPAGGEPAESERLELEQTLGALPEAFRTVYVLRMVEGISGIETAACLGLHETTVRTRLFRAHRRLAADIPQRLRAVPGVLDLSATRLERIVSRALAQLPHGSMLPISASAP
jgi:RNA polymerase sigma-70 factor, ECF subfamily